MTNTPDQSAGDLEAEPPIVDTEANAAEAEASVFDATYVAKLRAEAADNRIKAKRSDDLARQVVRAMARADGRLIDAEDLAFDQAFLDDDGLVDSDRVVGAIDQLIERKPHLAARRPEGTIGQGARPEPEQATLLGILNSLG